MGGRLCLDDQNPRISQSRKWREPRRSWSLDKSVNKPRRSDHSKILRVSGGQPRPLISTRIRVESSTVVVKHTEESTSMKKTQYI